MGYTTEFAGGIEVRPYMDFHTCEEIDDFAAERHCVNPMGDRTGDYEGYNKVAPGCPGLWCQWVTQRWEEEDGGDAIVWDGGEKFYNAAEWMQYIIDRFLAPKGYKCNGEIEAQGEDPDDMWKLVVADNKVSVKKGRKVYD